MIVLWTKAFSVGVLLAKIHALLRRVNQYTEKDDLTQEGLVLIDESIKLKYKAEILELSKNEYRALKILMNNRGKVVTREELLEILWDDTTFKEAKVSPDYNSNTF